jgi:hypothetical protein
MGRARKAVSWLVGGIQCALGGLGAVVAFLIYASQSLRETLAIAFQDVYVYMFLLLVFSVFSILSGLFLVHREQNGI